MPQMPNNYLAWRWNLRQLWNTWHQNGCWWRNLRTGHRMLHLRDSDNFDWVPTSSWSLTPNYSSWFCIKKLAKFSALQFAQSSGLSFLRIIDGEHLRCLFICSGWCGFSLGVLNIRTGRIILIGGVYCLSFLVMGLLLFVFSGYPYIIYRGKLPVS